MLPLNPQTLTMDWSNARACAEMCALVYVDGPFTSDQPTPFFISNEKTDAHAVVMDRGNCLVVCFRGSKNAEDYIQDGKFEMVDLVFSDGDLPARVHKGFLEDFDALNVQIISVVKTLRSKQNDLEGQWSKPIFITGHSLGAAQATLCALEFARLKFPIAGVYTFGSPRVGNASFCKLYDDELKDITFRFINQNDIVPRVPPLLNGYRHCGNCIFLFSGGSFGVNPALARRAWSNCLGFWQAFRTIHDVLVTDHHIGNYQAKLSECASTASRAALSKGIDDINEILGKIKS